MIKHGGNIDEAAIKFGIAKDEWLDLSTGLNPDPWSLDKPIPASYYQKLPYPDATFYGVASRYYKSLNLLAVPGSQAAIQSIPRLLKNKRVALPVPGYEEHLYHWQQNQHECITYNPDTVNLVEWVKEQQPDVVIVINPNNPSCRLHEQQELLAVLKLLEKNDGLLIVDEAFLDTNSNKSLIDIESDNLLVLRSLGKFFGLPGIRVGFVKAAQKWRDLIEEYLGAWAMNGPSLWVSTRCLADSKWQQSVTKQLHSMAKQQITFLDKMLPDNLTSEMNEKTHYQALTSTDYFTSYRTSLDLAKYIYDFYGQAGIFVRIIDLSSAKLPYEAIIRFGLCPSESLERFQSATSKLNQCLSQYSELSSSK